MTLESLKAENEVLRESLELESFRRDKFAIQMGNLLTSLANYENVEEEIKNHAMLQAAYFILIDSGVFKEPFVELAEELMLGITIEDKSMIEYMKRFEENSITEVKNYDDFKAAQRKSIEEYLKREVEKFVST